MFVLLAEEEGSLDTSEIWEVRGLRVAQRFKLGKMVLHLAWVRTSVELVGSRVLPATRVQVDVEGFST